MATLTLRGVPDEVKEKLRVRAARNGRSMEAEARAIIEAAVTKPPTYGLGTEIHQMFAGIGGVELDLPPRTDQARWVEFEDE